MPNLENSKRTLYKATYVPLRTQDDKNSKGGKSVKVSKDINQSNTGRVVEKVAYLRSLNIQPHEFTALEGHEMVNQLKVPQPAKGNNAPRSRADVHQNMSLLELAHKLITNISPVAMEEYAPLLVSVSADNLAALGYTLADIRRDVADTVRTKIQEIERHYQQVLSPSRETTTVAVLSTASLGSTFTDAALLAMKDNLPAFHELYTIALDHAPNPTALAVMHPMNVINNTVIQLISIHTNTRTLVDSFIARQHIEPVGWLHLERLEMTPVGVEHGELLHSVPLTPKETVNITHREWSVTTKTFEDMVQDSFEGFSEKGVTEKNDISEATDTQSRHTSALDVSGSVSASYNGAAYSVTASASADYHSTSDDFHSTKASQAHSQAITRTASARTRKDHKISFRVSSVAGAEDLSVRVLTNPSDQNAMRVDYFQLLRKWRVDLIRYGVRMTYDIVVPNPGHDIISQVREVQQLSDQISQPYTFLLSLSAVTPTSWQIWAELYSTEVDAPPGDPEFAMQTKKLDKAINETHTDSIDIDVPEGYEIEQDPKDTQFTADFHLNDNSGGESPSFAIVNGKDAIEVQPKGHKNIDAVLQDDLHTLWGKSGKVSVTYWWHNCDSGDVLMALKFKPKDAIIKAWQLRVWSQLRAADFAAYTQRIERKKERKAQLESEIAQWDGLTLQKREREEIMKCVLRWLLGSTFETALDDMNSLLSINPNDPNSIEYFKKLKTQDWQTIMRYGEFIKFIHNAIEWENVVFFTYPYFWDATDNWPFKQFLVYPDLQHREFLRAGSARIVLTIRPGFERDFAAFIDSGSSFAILPDHHPYVTIGEEIRNFAMTNYTGISPANPDQNARQQLHPEQRKAWKDMQVLMRLLEQYSDANQPAVNLDPSWPDPSLQDASGKVKVKVYPTTAQGLAALQPFANQHAIPWPLVDPWGRDYHYVSPGLNGDYDLVCYGANGAPGIPLGGTDLDADITSWAEGSVVARWYEYTPTSAMDVSINTVLPTTPQPA